MKINNLSVGIFFFAWVVVAQAQAAIAPQFGDQIAEIGIQTWALVFAYGAVGTIMRLQQAIKEREIQPNSLDVFVWCLLGIFSAFATFAICEQVNALASARMPDLIEGALISVGAYNHKRVISWLTTRLEKIFGSDVKAGKAEE